MDPIGAIFASIVDVISNPISQRFADVTGTQIQSVVVEHQGIQVPYSYQLWKIQPKSVCHSYGNNVEDFSALHGRRQIHVHGGLPAPAKEFPPPIGDTKLQNMYCTAAVSYQPTVANIGWSADTSPLDEARAACNLAIAELVGNPDPPLGNAKRLRAINTTR